MADQPLQSDSKGSGTGGSPADFRAIAAERLAMRQTLTDRVPAGSDPASMRQTTLRARAFLIFTHIPHSRIGQSATEVQHSADGVGAHLGAPTPDGGGGREP